MTIQKQDEDVCVSMPQMGPFGAHILNVKQLREILDGLDDHVQIIIDDGDGWYLNVHQVIVPAGEADMQEFCCLTFFTHGDFDSRQI